LIKKSKSATEFQRQLAIQEDKTLIKKMKLANIKIEKIDEENLIDFKNITQTFHQDYFKNYPHMQRYVTTS
jgi:TRAP-type C4-dicarboxylate transport system substrate-binding protein